MTGRYSRHARARTASHIATARLYHNAIIGSRLEIRPASKLTSELRVELKQRKAEVLALFDQQHSLLKKHVPSPVFEVFPDWQGMLIKSTTLGMSVWVVRNARDGEELAKETGQPALVLDDVLAQKGKTKAEARTALFPLLIVGGMQ